MNKDQRNKIEALLVKRGFNEQGMTKGLFIIPDGRNISADVRGEKPIVGVAIAGMIHTTGHGINAVQDIQNEVETIMNKENKEKQEEIKKGTTTAICQSCKCTIQGTIDTFRQIQDEYGVIYCQKCSEDADGKKEASPKASAKIPMCRKCGIEVPHARALACLGNNEPCTCEDCGEKQNGGNKMETEIVDQKLPATKKKQELVIGKCEAVAAQYGIPSEMANLFFMTMDGGLYIKNPGLLYLAGKKGYSRIEVTTTYDEKIQEWSAECRIYPKLTKDILEGIGRLDAGLQKTAFEFATQPTNGTGRASKANVKMSTMHAFLKEMAQTRATNRALRNFTGYGGTSQEELPEGHVELPEAQIERN